MDPTQTPIKDTNNSHLDLELNKVACPEIHTSEANPALCLRSKWEPEEGALGNTGKERKIKMPGRGAGGALQVTNAARTVGAKAMLS